MRSKPNSDIPSSRGAGDPLRPVARLGNDSSRAGLVAGTILAVLTHAGALSALGISGFGHAERLPADDAPVLVDVEVTDQPPAPSAPPQPDETAPEPMPEPEADEPAAEEPVGEPDDSNEPASDESSVYDDDAVAAAGEAVDVLTAEPAADAPVDMTGEGWDIVDGEGRGPSYGYRSQRGTARKATVDPRARVGGVSGGRGNGKRGVTRGGLRANRSRPAGLLGGTAWNCPFPAAADQSQIHRAVAVITVTVSPSGRATSVQILTDPGYGFGQAARSCAYGRRYQAALDASGRAITASTPPINVRFRR